MSLSPQRFTTVLSLALCLLGISVPASAEGGHSKLDKALRAARTNGTVQHVIIQTQAGYGASLKKALQQHGDVVEAEHPGLNALTAVVHGEDLAALEADPSVLAVSIDAEVTSFGAKGSRGNQRLNKGRGHEHGQPSATIDLLRETVGVSDLEFSGAGIHVAIVDSGIEPNRDLADNIDGFWDFTHGGIATRPSDEYGHGTHISGLIASTGLESNSEFAGVAPGVRLYGFKVLDSVGRGRTSDVVKALEFIVASKRSSAPGAPRIDIINLSLGHPIYEPAQSDPLVRAVENAVRAGIVVVTAAGNIGARKDGEPGYTGITSPGNAPSAITIGALDSKSTVRISDDTVASFSSRGPTWYDGFAKPDLLAPGVNLTSNAPRLSSLLTAYPQIGIVSRRGSGSFGRLSGTSMAAGVATGVASVVLQASRAANSGARGLTPNALKAVLQYTAVPLKDAQGVTYDALTQGTGGINARGAVAMAEAINTSMPVDSYWLRVPVNPVTWIDGELVPWSKALLWDDSIVRNTDALSFNSWQWSDNIVWGTSLGVDDNIVWGTAADVDNIVWGTVADWASALVWPNRLIGLMQDEDNIVWGTVAGLDADNIVWGTLDGDNIVWGTWDGENIVWGTSILDDVDNIVWGTSASVGGGLVVGIGGGR